MADAGAIALKAYLAEVRKIAWPLRVGGLVVVALGTLGILINGRSGLGLSTELGKSAVAMILIGWFCLIVSMMKRAAWVKAHPFVAPNED